MPEERINTITIGGVFLQRKSGGVTITSPVCQYANVRDDQLQKFWHWLASSDRVQKAMGDFNAAVSAELIAWGDQMGVEVKSDGREY